jgi:hypothetical protein
MQDNISKLKSLIEDYEEEKRELRNMVSNWEDGDPMSDPGLQYEQESKVDAAYNTIVEFAQTLKTV